MSAISTYNVPDKGLPLRALLWLAQVLLVGVYLPTGIAALFLPMAQVLAIVPWAGHVPEEILRFIGAVDLAAGLGVVLPSLTRIVPRLSVLAAVCSATLQTFAILFYVFLGALATMLPMNLTVFALSVFVAWGRSGKASIAPRWQDRRMSSIDVLVSDRSERSEGRCARWRTTVRGQKCRGKGFSDFNGVCSTPLSSRCQG